MTMEINKSERNLSFIWLISTICDQSKQLLLFSAKSEFCTFSAFSLCWQLLGNSCLIFLAGIAIIFINAWAKQKQPEKDFSITLLYKHFKSHLQDKLSVCQPASLLTHCNAHIGPATQKIAAVFLDQTCGWHKCLAFLQLSWILSRFRMLPILVIWVAYILTNLISIVWWSPGKVFTWRGTICGHRWAWIETNNLLWPP